MLFKKNIDKQHLEVLKILKKKKVNIEYLSELFTCQCRITLLLAKYNYYHNANKLTMTEFKKLKKWFERGNVR